MNQRHAAKICTVRLRTRCLSACTFCRDQPALHGPIRRNRTEGANRIPGEATAGQDTTAASPNGVFNKLNGAFAIMEGAFAIMGGGFAIMGGGFVNVRDAFAIVEDAFAIVGGAFAIVGGAFAIVGGAFVTMRDAFAIVEDAFAIVGGAFLIMGDAFAIMGGAFDIMGGAFAIMGGAFATMAHAFTATECAIARVKSAFTNMRGASPPVRHRARFPATSAPGGDRQRSEITGCSQHPQLTKPTIENPFADGRKPPNVREVMLVAAPEYSPVVQLHGENYVLRPARVSSTSPELDEPDLFAIVAFSVEGSEHIPVSQNFATLDEARRAFTEGFVWRENDQRAEELLMSSLSLGLVQPR